MRYRVEKSFAGNYRLNGQVVGISVGGGEEIELDDRAQHDFVKAGLLTPLESAMLATPKGRKAVALADVPGVLELEPELRALGIVTAADLAAADVKTLTGIKGVGKVTARQLIQNARKALR